MSDARIGQVCDHVRPVLTALGREMVYCGPAGLIDDAAKASGAAVPLLRTPRLV